MCGKKTAVWVIAHPLNCTGKNDCSLAAPLQDGLERFRELRLNLHFRYKSEGPKKSHYVHKLAKKQNTLDGKYEDIPKRWLCLANRLPWKIHGGRSSQKAQPNAARSESWSLQSFYCFIYLLIYFLAVGNEGVNVGWKTNVVPSKGQSHRDEQRERNQRREDAPGAVKTPQGRRSRLEIECLFPSSSSCLELYLFSI